MTAVGAPRAEADYGPQPRGKVHLRRNSLLEKCDTIVGRGERQCAVLTSRDGAVAALVTIGASDDGIDQIMWMLRPSKLTAALPRPPAWPVRNSIPTITKVQGYRRGSQPLVDRDWPRVAVADGSSPRGIQDDVRNAGIFKIELMDRFPLEDVDHLTGTNIRATLVGINHPSKK